MRRHLTTLFTLFSMACATSGAPTPDDETPAQSSTVGTCDYVNPFSQGPECKDYTGAGWDAVSAEADCDAPIVGASSGVFTPGASCPADEILGTCTFEVGTDTETVVTFPGTDPTGCGGAEIGCGFGSGVFTPSDVCEGGGQAPSGLAVFQPFKLTCEAPLAGEPAGAGPDGDVCTWGAISACTEEGREFADYGSCDVVRTQRPYYAAPAQLDADPSDPRLADLDWLAEADWVTEQVRSCACTCCHSSEEAPDGPANWYLEAGDLWIDTVDDDGLAMLAGWIDSTAFGAFDAADNNGFDRSITGLPTTDVDRMLDFLEGELDRRGLRPSDVADADPFGGPLYDQLVYEPSACGEGQGMTPQGELEWTGGGARYVYVLERGSLSPGVPPNLDTPDGTLWRVDVDPDDDPMTSPLTYGDAPRRAFQAVPAAGEAPTLTSGRTYYLVALRDIYQPITRCLFTAP